MSVRGQGNERIVLAETAAQMGVVNEDVDWTLERYEQWIENEYFPVIGRIDEDVEIHEERLLIGQFSDNAEVLVLGNRSVAFIKTAKGPVVLMQGPYAWNPSSEIELTRLCRHMNLTRKYNVETGYVYRKGSGATQFLIDFGERVITVGPNHPWHPEHGRWIRDNFDELQNHRSRQEFELTNHCDEQETHSEDGSSLSSRAMYVELQTLGQAIQAAFNDNQRRHGH